MLADISPGECRP